MRLEISAKGLNLIDITRSHVERRIRFALGRFVGRVEGVHVRLADVNGSKGRVDKSCRIRVRLFGLPTVVVEEADTDPHAAIDRAADRVGRTVARKLEQALTSIRDGRASEPKGEEP